METNYAVATGEWLQEWQDDNNVSTQELADRIEMSVEEVESILRGSAPVDETIAESLEKVTDIPARLWLNFEKRYVQDLERLNLKRPVRD